MLDPGGVVMLDDVPYPAINRVVRFILSNRDYELLDATHGNDSAAVTLKLRRAVKRVLRPLARTDRDPSLDHDRQFRRIDGARVVALRKRGDDARRFDHFEQF
jgi:hypothetical protein